MAFITKQDFKTHLKLYVIDAISDSDDEILQEAIDTALTTAKRYLSRFDTDIIFAATGSDRKKYADLITYIKDIAKWQFIKLANVMTDYDACRAGYKDAIAELSKINNGDPEPTDWPYPITDENQMPFTLSSRPKRGNFI